MARLPGVNNAPPMPWMMRATIRSRPLGARPHKAGGNREPHDADGEHPLAAEAVAERASEQQKGGERQRVPGDDPLQHAHFPVERSAD